MMSSANIGELNISRLACHGDRHPCIIVTVLITNDVHGHTDFLTFCDRSLPVNNPSYNAVAKKINTALRFVDGSWIADLRN